MSLVLIVVRAIAREYCQMRVSADNLSSIMSPLRGGGVDLAPIHGIRQ